MRLESVNRNVQSDGTMQVAKATIKATPKIFSFFSDQTYANKPVAICRELVANGIDAHVAAGQKDRPVEVYMPTELDPVFKVRDYGTGMPHDFVMGPFMAYTDGSTKDQDDTAIGGFGIGSKSPFAYCDQYTLRVVHEGVLSVYTMFKDEDGIPSIGLQAQTTTDEHNGVEVSFPVEFDDMETFRDAAQTALQYFQPLPIVENGKLNPPDYVHVGNGWAMAAKPGPLGVIMGGVRYPVATDNLEYDLRTDQKMKALLGYGLDVTLPIGAASIALSREALSYDKRTSEAIRNALLNIYDDVAATFSTMFDEEPSLYDAMVKLYQATDALGYNPRATLMKSAAKYKGAAMSTSFDVHQYAKNDRGIRGTVWHIYSSSAYRQASSLKKVDYKLVSDMHAITPGKIQHLIIDNLPNEPKSKTSSKVRYFIGDGVRTGDTLVLRARGADHTDPNSIKALLEALGSPTKVIYTSDLPEPPKVARVKSDRPRVRMFTFDGSKDKYTKTTLDNLTPAYSKLGVVEIKYEDQPKSGIMVVMTNFQLPPDLYQQIDTGLLRWDELVFVNEGDAEKIKKDFKNSVSVFQERLAKALSAYPDLATRIAVSNSDQLLPLFDLWQEISGNLTLTDAQKKRPFGRVVELYEKYVRPLDSFQRKLAPFVTVALPKEINPQKLVDAFAKHQADAKILMGVLSMSKPEHVALLGRNL